MSKVLLIEPDENLKNLLSSAIKFQKYEVIEATSTKEAAGLLQEEPDVILLDMLATEIKNDSFTIQARTKLGKNIPLLIMADLDNQEQQEEYSSWRANKILTKSNFMVGDVIRSIRTIIDE